jgi:CheY-like chemotaxis protein
MYKLSNKRTIVHEPTGTLVLTVKDTGAGMTKAQLKQLFGQGIQFNVNELQHGNGSGLGLYIAMGIVQQHEGSLTCDSEGLGHGTTFTMEVPLFDIPTPETSKRPNVGDTADEAGDTDYEDSKLNILIVDDAVSNRKLLRRLLNLKGHETAEAENGQIAVDMVREAEKNNNHFDLVLMDYEMPVMIGPIAAKEIRNLGSDVFIVGVTGNLMSEDVSYFRECGSNSVLPKPFRINELEDIIIENHITRHQHYELDGEPQAAKIVFADPGLV